MEPLRGLRRELGAAGEQVGSQPLRGVRFGPLDTPSVTVENEGRSEA